MRHTMYGHKTVSGFVFSTANIKNPKALLKLEFDTDDIKDRKPGDKICTNLKKHVYRAKEVLRINLSNLSDEETKVYLDLKNCLEEIEAREAEANESTNS